MRFFLLLLPLSLQKHKQPSMNRFHRPEQGKTRSVMLHVGRPEWREKNRRWTPHSDGSTLSLPPCTSIRSRDPHSFRSRQQHIHFLLFPLFQPCAWRPAHLRGDSDDLLAPLFSQPTDPEWRKPLLPSRCSTGAPRSSPCAAPPSGLDELAVHTCPCGACSGVASPSWDPGRGASPPVRSGDGATRSPASVRGRPSLAPPTHRRAARPASTCSTRLASTRGRGLPCSTHPAGERARAAGPPLIRPTADERAVEPSLHFALGCASPRCRRGGAAHPSPVRSPRHHHAQADA
jgi:hypothetical protein